MRSRFSLPLLVAVLFSIPSSMEGAVVDFVNGTWNHGSGNVTGWRQPPINTTPYSGTSILSNGAQISLTIRDFGTVNHNISASSDHLTADTLGGGSGLTLNQSSGSAYNDRNSSLNNYVRVDVALSEASYIEMFFHDIDNGNGSALDDWTDALYAESFNSGFGTLGSGTRSTDTLGSALTTTTLHTQGLVTIIPKSGTPNVQNSIVTAPDLLTSNSAKIGFTQPVQYFSFYYWNRNSTAEFQDNQRIIFSAFNVYAANVPEPRSWLLLGLTGLVGFCFQFRRTPLSLPGFAELS